MSGRGVGVILIVLLLAGCGQQRKLTQIRQRQLGATISLPPSRIDESTFRQYDSLYVQKDTMVVRMDGRQMFVMKAVKDEQTGESIATEQLKAAVVTARFRNVAERHGKIDLEFQLTVPSEMQSTNWQLRFYPDMFIMGDSLRLDNVIITGAEYRKQQLRGYEQYQRFLSRIVSDTTKFIDMRNLECWIARNLPKIYYFKSDSTFVSDDVFASCFGYTEQMAVEHYTNKLAKNLNERRKSRRGKMFARYVKSPILTEHIRLDTVMRMSNGDFEYDYVQTIRTRKGLRKVDILLSGDIYESNRRLYEIPRTEPLTFYISSLSTFTDVSPRYYTKIIERQVEANASWNIDFKQGKYDIDPTLGCNMEQIDNIKMNLRALLTNETFDLDSITIAAFASPEGSVAANTALSQKRAKSSVDYFNSYVRFVQDSVRNEAGLSLVVGDDLSEGAMHSAARFNMERIPFRTSASGENWKYLDALVGNDNSLSDEDKEHYRSLSDFRDLDAREKSMMQSGYYKYLRNEVYPRLRTVQFNFFLHRKGMVKDTVHTTELDTVYMKGVKMLVERDYEGAAAMLGPYNDFNTAIAYVSLDRNMSALSILSALRRTPKVLYMLALVYSRIGDEQKAVQSYLDAVALDPGYVHRGNLDPEIAALIKKYDLVKLIEEQ